MVERGKYDRGLSAAARKKQQRREILTAATLVFTRHGYAGASVEAIVREAGVSRRTYYEHFDDLPDALAAVHDAAGKAAIRVVDEQIEHAHTDERLELGIRALLTLIASNPGLARVLFVEARLAGKHFEARQDKLRAHFAAVLEETLRAEHARPDKLAVIAVVAGIEAVGGRVDDMSLDEATAAMVRLARAACTP